MTAAFILLCLIIIYGVIPTILIRQMGLGIYKKGLKEGAIALTFDDGPDPYYTPQLLDLLKKHGVKATFFVVGKKAKQHPEIIRRMHEEGHEIGLHNYRHVSNWFVLPLFLQQGLHKSARIIEEITGQRPIYYRPPWGHFNIFTWLVQAKYKTIMWTHILGDWKERVGVHGLFQRLKNSLTDRAIIVLHDSGETFGADEKAPGNMISALELLLEEEKAQKMEWVTISDMMNVQTNKQISSM
ncbi:polysaccharide deacetylase family protein [Anoxybacteroides tepidamans]|uniref:polysaccharide deacetylase family protein n=1 Tax=Anoxybacteroides tepidamans TaxID=265948 RepID=UPI000483053E|nr:polysaccharide deacetylase family protein [Anoxybacillus tepidamans]